MAVCNLFALLRAPYEQRKHLPRGNRSPSATAESFRKRHTQPLCQTPQNHRARILRCVAYGHLKPAPNNSSKRSPNHASNTSTSASVTGICSGQSSVTTQVERSCFGGRPVNGQGWPSNASSCSDAVGGRSLRSLAIAPESPNLTPERIAFSYAGSTRVPWRKKTCARRRGAETA